MTTRRPVLGWPARLAATLIAPAYRDEVVSDLADEQRRLRRSELWLVRQIVRSARDSRRIARTATRERQHSEGDRMRITSALPTFHDLRLAVRAVRRAGASTAAIVLTLAIGIGGTSAMFSVVHAVILQPLPYADPDRLVRVWERHVPRNRERNVVAPANFMEWRDRSRTLTSFAAFAPGTATVIGDGPPERVTSMAIMSNLLPALGVDPALGRTFLESDGRAGTAAPVVLLGWEFWQRRYGGDPGVVGRSVTVDGRPSTVVGVLPPGFRLFGRSRDLWTLMTPTEAWREPRGRGVEVVARLAPGATIADANAEMEVIAVALERQWPQFDTGWRVSVVDARTDLVGDLRRPLALLLAAVALVLLVGCANAANLLLARASERRREFEVRTALGATRARLLTGLALEGLVLGAAGTAAGLLLALVALRVLVDVVGPAFGVPRLDTATLNLPVLALALGVLSLCTAAFAMAPGWIASRATGRAVLTGATRTWTGGRLERRVRAGLVVAQVAFAVLLVISAGLVTRSLLRLMTVDPGFDPENVLTLTVSLPSATYAHDQQVRFFDAAAASLRALPGVDDAGAISFLPFSGPGIGTSYDVDGRVPLPAGSRPVADVRPVTAEYFSVMRIPLRRGRFFTPEEVRSGARVAIVNEDVVRRMFPNDDPIGQRLQVNFGEGLDEIVGVVGDVRISTLSSDVRSQIYFTQARANVGFVTYVIRTSVDDELSLARAAEDAIQALDPNLPVQNVRPMQGYIDASLAAPRLTTWLLGAFGGLALVLALVGVAGLQAAWVAARLPEFGIRLALGATPARIRALVLGQAGWLVGAGLLLGVAAAAAASRLLDGLLFGVAPIDLPTYAGTAAAIAGLGLLVSGISARRATAADPAQALRV